MLNIQGINKSFGKNKVLKGVDFKARKGEVKALLGSNGAGKSTLIKILGGIYTADSGKVYVDSQELDVLNAASSLTKGIGIIHQELSLVPTQTVMENVFLGREKTKGRHLIDWDAMYEETNNLLRELEFEISPKAKISELTLAERQMVEIIKVLSMDVDIIIMDEPTSSLTSKETEMLFKTITKLKEQNKTIIYVSHILEEIFQICDSVSILRDGIIVDEASVSDMSVERIARGMSGQSVDMLSREKKADKKTRTLLKVENLNNNQGVKDVNFHVKEGEVVGFAGLVGSGRTEIINSIYGICPATESSRIIVEGKEIKINKPIDAINHGIGLIPENRGQQGLNLIQSLVNNTCSVQLSRFIEKGIVRESLEKDFTEKSLNLLNTRYSHLDQPVKSLSGGNQQKVVISKWIDSPTNIMIFDEPTKGIDIAAKEDVFKVIDDLAFEGKGVIFISSDLDEVLRMSDRIYVINNHKIVKELNNVENNFSKELLMKEILIGEGA